MELILVDDGSPDRSGQMCDQWADGYKGSVKVAHRANGGLSAARNTGLSLATGQYVTFVDSDDFLAPNTYRPLLQELELHPEYDILEFPVCRFHGSARQSMLTFRPQAYRDMRQYWFSAQTYTHCYAWNKIYRRELFSYEQFPEGVLFEDTWVLPRLLLRSSCVATSDQGLYYYSDNPNGITATADGQTLKSLLNAHLTAMNIFPLDDSPECDIYYLHVANIQIMVSEQTGDVPLLPARHITSTARLKGVGRVKAYINNILGINMLCKTFKVIHHFRSPRS